VDVREFLATAAAMDFWTAAGYSRARTLEFEKEL
jgi:hypothetical protein